MTMDLKSCRICLAPSLNFINIFGKFHERSVREIIEETAMIVVEINSKLPKFICEQCLMSFLNAESIISICRKNNDFLNELVNIKNVESDGEKNNAVIVEVLDVKSSNIDEVKTFTVFEDSKSTNFEMPWETFEKLNEESKIQQKTTQNFTFFCSFCGKELSTRQKLIYHEKSRHSTLKMNQPIKPFTCDRCGMSFKQKSHMINHLNVVHLRIKRYQCNVCGFSMYSKSHYTAHVKTHSNIREFSCEKCEKSFARKETLMIHLKTHDGLRPYCCKFCGKSYTAHTDLKRHIFKHTNVKPYICQLCKLGFFLKRQLFEHVDKDHQGIDTSSWLNGKTSWTNLMN